MFGLTKNINDVNALHEKLSVLRELTYFEMQDGYDCVQRRVNSSLDIEEMKNISSLTTKMKDDGLKFIIEEFNNFIPAVKKFVEEYDYKYVIDDETYSILKRQGYLTPPHQDNQMSPHWVICCQTSGKSVYHFYPALIGHYLTAKKLENPENISMIKTKLKELYLIKTIDLNAGEVVIIIPDMAQEVIVPKGNFQFSTVRTVELKDYYKFSQDRFNTFINEALLREEKFNSFLMRQKIIGYCKNVASTFTKFTEELNIK